MPDDKAIRLLIVEDEASYARLLALALGNDKGPPPFDVRTADTLAGGVRAAAEGCDIAILDLNLSDSRGVATVESFLAAVPGIPVVVLSGLGDEKVVHECRRCGAEDYLVKGPEAASLVGRVLRYALHRHRAERDLKAGAEALKTILGALPTGVLLIDADTHTVVDANPAAARMLGLPKDQVTGRPCRDFVDHASHDACVITTLGQASDSREATLLAASGRKVPVLKNAAAVTVAGRRMILESFVDITDRKRLEEQLHSESLQDLLTGLYNRRGFLNLAEQTMRLARRNRWRLYLMFADLDGMKHINDTYGHPAGDEALRRAAEAVRRTFRESDIVARYGGDEFCALGGVMEELDERRIEARIRDHLAAARRRDDRFEVRLSLGFAYFSPHAPTTLEELVAEADRRMYARKRGEAE